METNLCRVVRAARQVSVWRSAIFDFQFHLGQVSLSLVTMSHVSDQLHEFVTAA
jgi:hypothetical protein